MLLWNHLLPHFSRYTEGLVLPHSKWKLGVLLPAHMEVWSESFAASQHSAAELLTNPEFVFVVSPTFGSIVIVTSPTFWSWPVLPSSKQKY